MLTALNQVLRTLLHSRLQLGIQQYQNDPSFQGDIILLEPCETDFSFFKIAPLNLWAGRSAGAHGYLSVTQAIDTHYELIRRILQSYGVLMTRKEKPDALEALLPTEPSTGPGTGPKNRLARGGLGRSPRVARFRPGRSRSTAHAAR